MTNTGSQSPLKPVVPGRRRPTIRRAIRGSSRSKVIITNLTEVRDESISYTEEQEEARESLPTLDSSVKTAERKSSTSSSNITSNSMSMIQPSATFPPYQAPAPAPFAHHHHHPCQMPHYPPPAAHYGHPSHNHSIGHTHSHAGHAIGNGGPHPQQQPFFRAPATATARDNNGRPMTMASFRPVPRGYHQNGRSAGMPPHHHMRPGPIHYGAYPTPPSWPTAPFHAPPPGSFAHWNKFPQQQQQQQQGRSFHQAKEQDGETTTMAAGPPSSRANAKGNRKPLLLDTALNIVPTPSMESQEEQSKATQKQGSAKKQAPPAMATAAEAPLTPIPSKFSSSSRDMDGKKLVMAVSASPTSVHSAAPAAAVKPDPAGTKEAPNYPDSPGQVFLSLMDDMSETNGHGGLTTVMDDDDEDGNENSIARQLGSIDNHFNFLPYLEDNESGHSMRTSPPMIPFLTKSPQLSWEVQEDDAPQTLGEEYHQGGGSHYSCFNQADTSDLPPFLEPPKLKSLQRKHKSELPSPPGAHADNSDNTTGTQSLFHEDAVFFGCKRIEERGTFYDTEEPLEQDPSRSWSDPPSLDYEAEAARQQTMSRDDLESNDGGRSNNGNREATFPLSYPSPQGEFKGFQQSAQPFGSPFARTPQIFARAAFIPGIEPSRSFPCPNGPALSPNPAAFLQGIESARSFPTPRPTGQSMGNGKKKRSFVPGIESAKSFDVAGSLKPASVPGIESSKSFPDQVFGAQAKNSRGRCLPLKNPVPNVMHQFGSTTDAVAAAASDKNLPEFSELVNFPTDIRQARTLPPGMRCCVMCGGVRSTCSRVRSRKNKESSHPMSPGGGDSNAFVCDDFVTIPTQNKGLCTLCDISVWVVQKTGCQIKWCKGCKNFRQWACFGDKGFATKCARCRERQREKYAQLKDAKMKATRKGGKA